MAIEEEANVEVEAEVNEEVVEAEAAVTGEDLRLPVTRTSLKPVRMKEKATKSNKQEDSNKAMAGKTKEGKLKTR